MEDSFIQERAFRALNLKQYSKLNFPEYVGRLDLEVPERREYVLRMLVRRMFGEFQLPTHLEWTLPFIEKAYQYQKELGITQPFAYLTVRNGIVDTKTDDEWHVDGFSQTITHLPEQNYVWTDKMPTEYVVKKFFFPEDFDGLKHNIHNYFQKRTHDSEALVMDEKSIYGLDPYVVHRRPKITDGMNRCFLRISFTPIEIEDVNNTYNPFIPTDYKRDGVKEMRENLINYDKQV